MFYLAIILGLGFLLALGSKSKKKSVDDMELLFNSELQKIKSDSVLNFIDTDFLDRNFEYFGSPKYSLAANDAEDMNYKITSLQDLTPLDLA